MKERNGSLDLGERGKIVSRLRYLCASALAPTLTGFLFRESTHLFLSKLEEKRGSNHSNVRGELDFGTWRAKSLPLGCKPPAS